MHAIPLVFFAALVSIDTWEYPGSSGQAASTARVGDRVVATSFTNEYDHSFDKVAKWYAKRTGFEALKTKLVAYRNRASGDSDFSSGTSDAVKVDGSDVSGGTALFNFSPQHMHVMIVLSDRQTGDSISISIAGNDQFTTVNFVRRPQPSKNPG